VIPPIIADPDDEFYQKKNSSNAANSATAQASTNKLKSRAKPAAARKNLQKKATPVKADAVKIPRGFKKLLVKLDPSLDDPKLKQKCCVKLNNLDLEDWMRRKANPSDRKLLHGKPFVRINRIPPYAKHTVYCMEHKVRKCPCI